MGDRIRREARSEEKFEVDDMGDLESPGGTPVPETGGRNSEFSRSRLGVGVRRGWSTPSSGKKRGRPTGARSPDASTIRTEGRSTNTVVPKFDGDGCWQQHLQIFNAIAKSNGWEDETAALQLFAHLEGESLNVALLMPKGERANWEGLSQILSNYYYSPARLAVFKRTFESVTRRTGADPATCGPTELWAATSPRQCSSGYADPGDCGSLPGVGESFGTQEGVIPMHELIWTGDIRVVR